MDDFKFNVGDMVKVVRCGQAYTTYENWFNEQGLGAYYTTRYAYSINPYDINDSETVYKVVKRGTHHYGDDNLYLIQRDDYAPMFLIGEEGLKAVKDKFLVKNELCHDLRNYCKEILMENDMEEDTIGEVESEILAIAEKLADVICD